jgi:hypothetical protein
MPVASGELYLVTLVMLAAGQTVENVLCFRERSGLSTDDDIKAAVRSFWSSYRAVISTDVILQELRAKRMTPIPLDTLIFPPTTGEETGGRGGGMGNNTIAAITTLRTGLSGKRHRGRVYSPGVAVADVTDSYNRLSGGGIAARDTAWDAIMAEFDDATGTSLVLALGIYSRLIGGQNPFTVAGWQAVTQYVNRPLLGNQRRRREGVGA